MRAATVRAQAKINVFLRVTGRDASGYHQLETLFARIALADVVTMHLTPSTRTLDCSGPALPRAGGGLGSVADNLAWRAARVYSDAARWPGGFAIEVEKHIPVSAGLGGGSADAGAVLRILNALNPRPLPAAEMFALARSLGADVPFLTQAESSFALARGRGDEYLALPSLPERSCLLAIVSTGVPTREAYTWLDETRAWTGRTIAPPNSGVEPSRVATWDDVRDIAHNDFEAVVFARRPDVAAGWRYLTEVAQSDPAAFARMSGSGGASFAILSPESEPIGGPPRAAAPPDIHVVVTRTAERVESVEILD